METQDTITPLASAAAETLPLFDLASGSPGDRERPSAGGASTTYHGWACTGPYFETVLFIHCFDRALAASSPPGIQFPVALELYDPDGMMCNKVEVQVSPHSVTGVEWDPFMGSCKFEAGFKHAHVIAHLPPGFRAISRLIARESACMLGAPAELNTTARAFFPVLLSRERFPLLIMVNRSAIEATVRGRLFCGKRTPETVWTLPPLGVRLVSIAHEFGDSIALEPEEQVQAYLRLGVRGEYEVSVQFVERLQGPKDGSLFIAVS